jgi:hypothetical protein
MEPICRAKVEVTSKLLFLPAAMGIVSLLALHVDGILKLHIAVEQGGEEP